MTTEANQTASTLELARTAFEEATLERARAYASDGPSSEVARLSALASTKAARAQRVYEKAILDAAQVVDPGLSHLP